MTREEAIKLRPDLAELLARKPSKRKTRLPAIPLAEAQRLHAQMGEVLRGRELYELRRMREPDRYQEAIDRCVERRLAAAEYERHFREEWNAIEEEQMRSGVMELLRKRGLV
jgi:hypothetical protein